MKVLKIISLFLLLSNFAVAETYEDVVSNKTISNSARLSLNEDEIKSAHARLLAAEAKLLSAEQESDSSNVSKKEIITPKSAVTATKVSTTNTSNSSNSALKAKSPSTSFSESSSLRNRIQTLEAEKAALYKELNFAKDKLLVAETEVERLQGLIENRTHRILSPTAVTTQTKTVATQTSITNSPVLTNAQKEKVTADMPIVTVTARKANLRIGPSEADSPLMEVASGTRLVVETRLGEWYRIIAPTGVRAWISAKVVAFGGNGTESPSRVTRIAGFDSSVEDEAFGLIASLSK